MIPKDLWYEIYKYLDVKSITKLLSVFKESNIFNLTIYNILECIGCHEHEFCLYVPQLSLIEYSSKRSDCINIIKMIDYIYNLDFVRISAFSNRNCIIDLAIIHNNFELLQFISTRINLKNLYSDKDVPYLHKAILTKNKNIIELFLDNPDVRDRTGKTALHKAAEFTNVDIVKFLVEKGADPCALCKYGRSVFMFALNNITLINYTCIIQYFCEIDVDPNLGDFSPLFHSCREKKHITVVKMLLEAGADPDYTEIMTCNSPLKMAIRYEDKELIDLLLKYTQKIKIKHKVYYISSSDD